MVTIWTDVPAEIWFVIVGFAGSGSWHSLSLVNKCFRNLVIQQERVSKRLVTIRFPKKLSQKFWKRLQARSVLNLNQKKCNPANLSFILDKLPNITRLKVHIDNLKESSLKSLSSSESLPLLVEIDLGFTNARETSLDPLKTLNAKLLRLTLKGSFLGSCNAFLQPLLELKNLEKLSLNLQWSIMGLEWDKARVLARAASNVIQCLGGVKHLRYRFEAHSNCEALFASCEEATLRKLRTLHLEKAVFNSAPTRLRFMSQLQSLTLMDCLSMISHHSNFFEGMSSLTEVTLRHVEDSPNILSHLPSTLKRISLSSMTSTKAFSMFLQKFGQNIEHLELDGVFEINCMLVESFPNILPNLKTFYFRNNYFEFGTIMSFLRFSKLKELDMTGCTSHDNVDTSRLRRIVKDSTDNKLIFSI